MMIHTGI